ncbi:MAG: hypothetical protein M3R04_09830 [bacterium]|nr:hypothetical protein [bacterium]
MTIQGLRKPGIIVLLLCALMMTFTLSSAAPTLAQGPCAAMAPGSDGAIPVSCYIDLADAVRRTPAHMDAAAQQEALAPAAAVPTLPFRPTVSAAEYARLKANAGARAPGQTKLDAAASQGAAPDAAAPLTPVTVGPNFAGASQNGLFPPDTHGAVGATQFVEVTNSQIHVYPKAGGAPTIRSLATFYGYTAQTLFDPRVAYDPIWKRWIVLSDARPESSTVQRNFLAISQTSNANGAYWIYNFDVEFGTSNFWDYPQLGFDQDAIIITANIFPASGAPAAAELSIAKARLYNGLGWSVPVFRGLIPTLAPPIVLDQNPSSFLIAASPSGTVLRKYTLTNSSRINPTLTGPVSITVPAYTVPPNAPQPGTAQVLDTSDSRFVNASTQIGNLLWQVHTVALGGFAAPKAYRINTSTNTQINAFFFATGTSDDFNASIAANSSNGVFVTWSATDTNTRPQVRAAACAAQGAVAGLCNFATDDVALTTSPASLTGNFQASFGSQRWGDYSAVSIDPANSKRAYVVNERVPVAGSWGSQIGAITLP